MTATELLHIIRRDIGQRLTQELAFSLSNHYAANLKGLNAASRSIEAWIDDLIKENLSPGYSGYSTDKEYYAGTKEDWMNRTWAAEAQLDKIKDILK